MINGEGVMGKYNAIVAARQAELYAGKPASERPALNEQLRLFIDEVRNSSPTEFEQWYELYK